MSSSSFKKIRESHTQLYLWLAVAAVSLGWGFFTAVKPEGSYDLKLVRMWLHMWLIDGSHVYSLIGFVGTNYPPYAIAALSPLALLPENWLALIWALVNLTLAPLVGYLALRAMKPEAEWREWVLPCAMFLAWAGLRTGIGNGQFTLLVLGSGLLALLLADKRPVLSGLLLALALMKPHIGGAFLLWALLTKRWNVTLIACLWMGLGVGLFSLRLRESPIESVRAYLGVLQYQFGRGQASQLSISLRVIELRPLIALLVQNEVWADRINQLLLVLMLMCVGAIGLMKSALARRQREAFVLQLCCLLLLMSVFHNPYDSILLLPIFAGLWVDSAAPVARSGGWGNKAALWVLQLAMAIELPGLWWKLSQRFDLSSFNWIGLFPSNLDRVLVLGLFVYLLICIRRDWSAGRGTCPSCDAELVSECLNGCSS